jgi:cell division protease FtsH
MFNLVRGLRLANPVDIHLLAQKTIGMVGRDLANAVDEAASAGRRRCQPIIELEDFVEAIDRIRLGFDKKDWGDGNEEYPACVPERISL